MRQWFDDFNKASKYRETMDYIEKGGKNPNKKKLKESITPEHEDRLRKTVAEYAYQVRNIIQHMTMRDERGNYLADLVEKDPKGEEMLDKLYDARWALEEFAKTSADRQREEAEALAMPEGGYEHFGY